MSKNKKRKTASRSIADQLRKSRDINSKDIFRNNVLASQFLRDYSGNSLFSNVQPEDLENQTEKFRLLLGIEVDGDNVIKVRIRFGDIERYIYVIALIEHKSYVDYDVPMQMLLYMTVIWREYAREQNKKVKGASKRKDFRYPLIFPIVYYEGSDKWTAGMHLADRIEYAELAKGFIPDFAYQVVPLIDYSDADFYKCNNEISLLMMINKIHGPEDFARFRKTAREFMENVFNNTTPDIQDLIIRVVWSLLLKMKVPADEVATLLNDVREGNNMGVLFESFKEYDALEFREDLKKAQKELKQVKEELDRSKEELDRSKEELDRSKEELDRSKEELDRSKEELTKEREKSAMAESVLFDIRVGYINLCRKEGKSREETYQALISQYLMEEEEAGKFLDDYWK